VKINQLDPNTANAQFQKLDYDMSPTLWTMDISDPDELATFAVDPKSGAKSFFTMYNNPAVVNATHQAEKTLDTEKRQQLYNTLQTGAAKDAFMAFLYYSPYPYATTTNVHGFFVTPLGNMHMENVWLSK
jgi:peptide/nickel transport system substrate-binding protein